ncbi:MAG: hypothetical protein M1837_002547 [Sclerophora amabilis]|nr:MAG: hypothetical protein M1837_002547 [Sclerophora amabilis]
MSEYWKSTPNIWCKYCKTYVRDTKLERQNHDATPRHQGKLQRFLRDLHRGNEREIRDKDRAKQEVERLNGVVSGSTGAGGVPNASSTPSTSKTTPPWKPRSTIPVQYPQLQQPRQPTPAERKKQLAQLAEMGVTIPDEFRGEMAMAGEWQTLSETPVANVGVKQEDGDNKPDVHNIGVRKRKLPDDEENEETRGDTGTVRKGWGSTIRTYPGSDLADTVLDALLQHSRSSRNDAAAAEQREPHPNIPSPSLKVEQGIDAPDNNSHGANNASSSLTAIKREESGDMEMAVPVAALQQEDAGPVKQEQEEGENLSNGAVMFKKRKAKSVRQK